MLMTTTMTTVVMARQKLTLIDDLHGSIDGIVVVVVVNCCQLKQVLVVVVVGQRQAGANSRPRLEWRHCRRYSLSCYCDVGCLHVGRLYWSIVVVDDDGA